MNAGVFAELLSRQGILILHRISAGAFVPVGNLPAWTSGLILPDLSADHPLAPGTIFSFLDYFLIEAEQFWDAGVDGELPSGIWTESPLDDKEFRLVAAASMVSGEKLLLIRLMTTDFDELQRIYQKGRDFSLANERLRAETSKKEILLHCIVHDLSGPLGGINGTLQVLEGENLSPQCTRLVQIGRRAARQQSLLIQDLLATFRSETGAIDTIDPDPAHAPDVVAVGRDVLEALGPACAVRGITGRVEKDADLPERVPVTGERGRLERIFHNLIQNALRYSPRRGTITIAFQKQDGMVQVSIEDEGPGVPPEVIPQLFQKFVRAGDNSGKSGLGLYFCRISVEQWGGTIGCETRPEGGTRFWFRLNMV